MEKLGNRTEERLGWDDVERLVEKLLLQLPEPRSYDALLSITRGGMIPAALLSEALDIRNIMVAAVVFYQGPGDQQKKRPFFWQFPEGELVCQKKILVVDDIWSDGRTAMAVKIRLIASGAKPEVAVLHYRPEDSQYPNERPDYVGAVTDKWIVYPWDRLAEGKREPR